MLANTLKQFFALPEGGIIYLEESDLYPSFYFVVNEIITYARKIMK